MSKKKERTEGTKLLSYQQEEKRRRQRHGRDMKDTRV
jgi:hypothetical protein